MCAYLRLSAFMCAGMCPHGVWVCVCVEYTSLRYHPHVCIYVSPKWVPMCVCVWGDHNFRVVILEFTLIISHICCNASFNASLQGGWGGESCSQPKGGRTGCVLVFWCCCCCCCFCILNILSK